MPASKKPAVKKGADKRQTAILLGGAGVVGVLLWRNMHGAASTTVAGAPAGAGQQSSASVAPYTPQTPITLSAGESVYDPNTGALLGGDSGASATQTVAPSAPSYTVNVSYPKPAAVKKVTAKPAKRKVVKRG